MLTIRTGTDADGPRLAALIADVFGEYDGCPFVAAEFPELDAVASHYAARGGAVWVLAEDGGAGRVVGCLALSRVDATQVFELHKVYLAADRRGAGWATRLYDVAMERVRAEGGTAVRLWTDTRFTSGHRFYERKGFRRLPVDRYLADATKAWEHAYRIEIA